MKKTIKVKFENFYESFDSNDNALVWAIKKKYNVVISENPDYLFYSVYQKAPKSKSVYKQGDFIRKISPTLYVYLRKLYAKLIHRKTEKYVPKGDFVKIFYSSENTLPNMDECDWAISSYPEEKVNHPNYIRFPMHKMPDYPFKKNKELPFRRVVNFSKIKDEKTRFCNFLYAQDIINRNNFFKMLNKYKKVDSPGRCMNNMAPISKGSSRESRFSDDWATVKLKFLKKYKFTIAFENAVSPGWITEKLTHPLLVNSLPIFVGTETVTNDFNPKCFLNRNDFKTLEDFIKYIIKVDNDDELYRWHLEQPIFLNKAQHYFNSSKLIEDKLLSIIDIEEKKKLSKNKLS